jgi:hypothetical protein
VLVNDTFDLVDGFRTLLDQILPDVGMLPNLGIGGIGRKNPADTVGTLSALESFAVIPKQLAEDVCIAFVGLVHGGVVGLNDNDFGASGLLEFFKQPVVEAANFDDCHVATMFASLLGEGDEKIVNFSMSGTDLTLLDHISVFIPNIDGQMVLVLVDS